MPLRSSAGEWLIDPRVNVREAYTDNVTLTERDKLNDLITTVIPGVTVRGESARLDLNLDYNLQYLDYLDHGQFDDLFHQMQADGELMLAEDLLYFTARSRMSQQNTSNGLQFVQSNRSQTGNRTSVLFYEYGPSLRRSLGSWASLDASYFMNTNDRSAVRGPNPRTGTTDEDVINVRLSSGPRIPRTPVNVTFLSREQERQNGRKSELKRVAADVGYRLNRFLLFTVEGGSEFNDFETTRRANRDGPFWFVGGTWTPSPRTSIQGRYGDRFFGSTFSVNASHRMRRVVFGFNYGERVRTTNQIQSELELIPLEDAFGNPVLDPAAASDILTPPDVPTLADDVVISRDIGASMSYLGRRQTFNVRFFENENDFQRTGLVRTNRGVFFDLTHSVTRLTTAALSGLWRESDSSNNGLRTIRISPSLRFALGRHMSLNLSYEFIDGEGDRARNNFTENAVTADVAYVF